MIRYLIVIYLNINNVKDYLLSHNTHYFMSECHRGEKCFDLSTLQNMFLDV